MASELGIRTLKTCGPPIKYITAESVLSFFEFTMNMVFLVTACFLVAGLTFIIAHIECEQHPQASLLNVKESIIHLIGPLGNSF